MDCERADILLNARLDGELDPGGADARELEAHLEGCAACRAVAAALASDDGALREAFADERADVSRVAEGTIARLRVEARRARTTPPWWRRAELGLAMAAGFLLAFVVLRPWEKKVDVRVVEVPTTGPATTKAVAEPSLATLALATGAVECKTDDGWQAMPTGGALQPGAVVRTGPNVRCEFTTPEGSLVRVNEQSEITFLRPRQLELASGQVWSTVARAPEPFRVKVSDAEVTALGTQFDLRCPDSKSASTTLTVVEGATRVTDGFGGEKTVRSGQRLEIAAGRVQEPHQVGDLMIATRWVNELLVMKGRDNAELSRRIDGLFAQIGRVKISSMYEEEIRSLGDHCVVPLTAFLCDNRPQDKDDQRQAAARILADVAQPWSAGELIKLLPDRDGEVRYHAARALRRVAGFDFGRSPEQYRDEPPERAAGDVRRWEQWWEKNRDRFPRLPAN